MVKVFISIALVFFGLAGPLQARDMDLESLIPSLMADTGPLEAEDLVVALDEQALAIEIEAALDYDAYDGIVVEYHEYTRSRIAHSPVPVFTITSGKTQSLGEVETGILALPSGGSSPFLRPTGTGVNVPLAKAARSLSPQSVWKSIQRPENYHSIRNGYAGRIEIKQHSRFAFVFSRLIPLSSFFSRIPSTLSFVLPVYRSFPQLSSPRFDSFLLSHFTYSAYSGENPDTALRQESSRLYKSISEPGPCL